MDKATRVARQRMKAQRTPRGQLSYYEPRGLGRKGKPAATFPSSTCSHVSGGKKVPIRRKRKDGSTYTLMILVGGVRCPNLATTTRPDGQKRCPQHYRDTEE